ncbi:MAG TPA: ATP-binding protein, partial [Phycisphaerae bacterium]|nr:ATP-binding protein [Phycisphaerae bacterium]
IQAMFKLIPEQSLSERVRYTSIRIEKFLADVDEAMKPWVERRHQKLIIKDETNNSIISADEGKLRDIIENLLMNAVKFTPDEGWIKLTVQRRLGGLVAFQVTDQGPGIPEADQPHIFEPFFSGSDTLHHSTGKSGFGKKGMGLGLAIVKHFVDLHRGTISFISGPTGTTFTVEIPADPSWSPENH